MKMLVLTDEPGGYGDMGVSEVMGTDRRRADRAVRMNFWNGNFVVVSGQTARDLDRLGVIRPGGFAA